MTTTNLLTTKLRNGLTVLAKETKYGINPVSYCNSTQAETKALLLTAMGIDCHVIGYGQSVKYIKIN